MWPFRPKHPPPPRDDIIVGGIRAHFDTRLKRWEFEIDGVTFTLSGKEFLTEAFQWARLALDDMKALAAEIDKRVLEQLEHWPCNPASRSLSSISLDDYATEKKFVLVFFGDDSWADFAVDVILSDGRIVDAYGGD